MKNQINPLKILACPKCKGRLKKNLPFLYCTRCEVSYAYKNKIYDFISFKKINKLSLKKWDDIYSKKIKDTSFHEDFKVYKEQFFSGVYKQLTDTYKFNNNSVYLEIGCGDFFNGVLMSDKVGLVIGIDISPNALVVAKKLLDLNGVKNYLLIRGDILDLPILDTSINFAYGGGVIEHFENTQESLEELFRVLKRDGISFNSVPYLNIASLTYRQLWGNIPDAPVIKNIFEFIHVKILKGRHMRFGYEKSFSKGRLSKLHKDAGFASTSVERFVTPLYFEYLPTSIRPLFKYLAAKYESFWPMVKVIAKK